MTTVIPSTIPHGRTAQRLEWSHLPPVVRAQVEERCGSPIVEAVSQGGGFTPGFASVLICEDGSRHFVKAASNAAQRMFAASYREEARKMRALPDSVPAPRLLWSFEDEWVVLGLEYVAARPPKRPWRAADLDLCLDALGVVAKRLTPVPAELGLDPIAEELADWPAFWEELRGRPDLPHADEAAALASSFADVVVGDTVVHTDVRDDNVLLTTDGRALFCDWNWPVAGADWLDSLIMLIGPRGDGLDVDAVIATRPLLRDVPADHLDRVLALVCGYFLKSADEPVPSTSPYIRDAQRWQGEVVWDWLCERRGWCP
ncbi:MAG TPA: phosphotransferase [Marmoricola sp.]|nr:phosphotransferase [Marmoricola sp.]